MRRASLLLAALLSAALLYLAFPMPDIGWLAWIGLVPLFLALRNLRPATAFGLAFICGVLFFSGILIWVYHIPGFRPIHHILVGLYLGSFFGFFGCLFAFLSRRRSIVAAHVAAPFLWVSLEYLRTKSAFLSLPWGFLSHTQYRFPLVIQVSSLTGAYGVSFLVVAVNSAIALAVMALLSRISGRNVPSGRRSRAFAVTAWMSATALMVGMTLIYGEVALSGPTEGKALKLSVLQGNIGREMKANPRKFSRQIMKIYTSLSEEAARDQPDLIVWPEAATPGLVLKSPQLHGQITGLARRLDTHLLVGSSEYPKFSVEDGTTERTGNTALHYSPEGRILGQYLKINLVPFGEYLPYEESFPWPEFIAPPTRTHWDLPGREHTLFDLDGTPFGVIICWEQVFPGLFRSFVGKGAELILNITNEAWFGDSAAPRQMLAISVFRAVENRVPLVRAANTGISCFIDRYGKITGRVMRGGKDTFVRGYLTQETVVKGEKTFYTRYGDLFALFSAVVAMLLTGTALLRPSSRINVRKVVQ